MLANVLPLKNKYGMGILSTVEYCPVCKMCFYYPVMLEDDVGRMRVIGQPLDRAADGLCEECHKLQVTQLRRRSG